MDNYKNRVKFSQQKDVMKLVITNNFKKPEELLEFLTIFSEEITKLFNGEIPQNQSTEEPASD